MNKSVWYIGLLIIILAAVGVYAYGHNKAKAPTTENSPSSETQQQSPAANLQQSTSTGAGLNAGASGKLNTITSPNPKGGQSQGTFTTGEGDVTAPDIQVVEIDFDGSQFVPSQVTIKSGDYVIFKNKSTMDFWPASNPHPVHTDYPGFDAKQNIAPNGTYKFQFTKVGDWGFHDHLDPSIGGTVHVTN